ncbi:hypothetical protein ACE6H2_009562 [Prunus campanulata]
MTCSPHHNNNDDNSSLCQLHHLQLEITHLVMQFKIRMRKSIISKSVDDMVQKIHHLQSVFFTLKGDSLATDERLHAIEEEVRLLWAASRKYNFNLHVLLKRSCISSIYGQWL